MLAIEIATTGRKKHQYTLANLLDEFRDYLIKYHQDVLDPKLRFIRSDEAKRYAASQYLHYKRLLKENLPLIQAGKMKHGQNEATYEIYDAMLQEDEWEEQDEWSDYILDDARQNALPPAPDDIE